MLGNYKQHNLLKDVKNDRFQQEKHIKSCAFQQKFIAVSKEFPNNGFSNTFKQEQNCWDKLITLQLYKMSWKVSTCFWNYWTKFYMSMTVNSRKVLLRYDILQSKFSDRKYSKVHSVVQKEIQSAFFSHTTLYKSLYSQHRHCLCDSSTI